MPPRELLFRWLLAAGVFALLLTVFCPAWGAFRLWSRVPEMGGMVETRRGESVLAQVANPGAPIADPLHRAIQWRLLFPIIGHVLHLPPFWFFGLSYLGCFLALTYLAGLLRRENFPWSETALALVVIGAASWFFTSTGWLGYFDSWLALGLLVVAFDPRRWAIILACVLAPWVDERFVLAAPLALLCRWLGRPASLRFKIDGLIPGALLAAFVFVRLGLLTTQSDAGATVGGYLGSRDFLAASLPRIALGIWEGLRGGWVFVVAAVVLLWQRRAHALMLGMALLVLASIGLATAQDYSRSMTMLLPAAVLGLHLARARGVAWLPLALRMSAGGALLLPAHHVMNDAVAPIFNLQHALDALDHPPALAMPEVHELRAIHAMERAEFAEADDALALAIKLAANPAAPARQRGILAATQGRWADARKYFSLMAEHDPQNPDTWLMCAQASHALNEPNAARIEIERALGLAPAGWKTRPDVARFLVKLNAAGARK